MTDVADSPDAVHVIGFDHLVLRVKDPARSVEFYVGTFSLRPERLEEWRRGEVPFPSVRVDPSTVIDLDARKVADGCNVDHFCLELAPTDLELFLARPGLDIVGGPFRRWGARGEADLVYVRDPDGNVIELRHYGEARGFGYYGQ